MTDPAVRERFAFRLPARWRIPLLVYGVTPSRAYVEIDAERLTARFGLFGVRTAVANLDHYSVTGPYRWWRAIGIRISLVDGGLTFGSATAGGVCIHFRSRVRFLVFRPPALTVTVRDVDALRRALAARGVRSDHAAGD